MRYIYTVLFYFALPFILLRLVWRGYRGDQLSQRLGFYNDRTATTSSLWVHAVSYGETVAVEPFIGLLRKTYPTIPIVITSMTVTGAERVKQTWIHDTMVKQFYVPYDIPFAIKRFFQHVKPQIGIIMETELWPNILHFAGCKQIPILLANARLSEKSVRGYQRALPLFRSVLPNLTHIAAQSSLDAQRFLSLGVPDNAITVTGNVKFDHEVPQQQVTKARELRATLPYDLVITAASTHANEEEQLLDIYAKLSFKFPRLLLIIVPRHPPRFDDVASLCQQKGYTVARRSLNQQPKGENIFLGDSMGEIYFYYTLADIAFVGGSLVPIGGHNLLEPAALALPIVTGPHLANFVAISESLTQAQALAIAEGETLLEALQDLLRHPDTRARMGKHALRVYQSNQGATERHLKLIQPWINDIQSLKVALGTNVQF